MYADYVPTISSGSSICPAGLVGGSIFGIRMPGDGSAYETLDPNSLTVKPLNPKLKIAYGLKCIGIVYRPSSG